MPQSVQVAVKQKHMNLFKKAFDPENPLACIEGEKTETAEPEKAESEHTGPGYVFCPEGGPYAGNRISCIITCSNCDQRDNCNEYQLYLESQKGNATEQF